MTYFKKLYQAKKITPPKSLLDNVHYECLTGSNAYGVSNDTSDMDIYGFAIPRKELVFPHLDGYIFGFNKPRHVFEQYQEHHLNLNTKEIDLTIYNITKFFRLCADNNPNMVDCLFVPQDCVLSITSVGQMVRERRHLFLSKKSYHTFKGYAYAQMKKIKDKSPTQGRRKQTVDEFGYDVKYAYHLVRLTDECEQILETGDLDLRRNKDQLIAIREGRWTLKEVEEFFKEKEHSLERLYHKSSLRNSVDMDAITNLLIECLQSHYGADLSSGFISSKTCPKCAQIKSILEA